MVMSLALLPAEKITAAWQELRDEAIPSLSPSDKRQLVDFRRYVESYWMCQVTPAVLSVAFTPRRTNNEVEARNRQLNQKARTAHPAPFTMATLIGEELSAAERDIQAMDNGNPVRGNSRNMFACKESKLLRWQRAVQRGNLHHSDFLVKVAQLNKKYLLQTQRYLENHARRLGDRLQPLPANEEDEESEDEENSDLDNVEEVVASSDEESPVF